MEGAPSPTRRRRVAAVPAGRHILAPGDAAPGASQHGASTALRAPPSFEGVHADRPADPAGQGHLHAPARLSDDGPAGRKAMVACSVAGGCSARPELWRAAVCSPQRAREAGSGGWPTHARLAPQACTERRAAAVAVADVARALRRAVLERIAHARRGATQRCQELQTSTSRLSMHV